MPKYKRTTTNIENGADGKTNTLLQVLTANKKTRRIEPKDERTITA